MKKRRILWSTLVLTALLGATWLVVPRLRLDIFQSTLAIGTVEIKLWSVAQLRAIAIHEKRQNNAGSGFVLAGQGRPTPEAERVSRVLGTALRDRNSRVSDAALSALETIGRPALPTLQRALHEEHLQYRVLALLERMGRAALPALFEALTHEKASIRVSAALAIEMHLVNRRRPIRRSSVTALQQALNDEWWYIREIAARALGYADGNSSSVRAALTKALGDGAATVREAARASLDRIQDLSIEASR